jgi:hypothetical protein
VFLSDSLGAFVSLALCAVGVGHIPLAFAAFRLLLPPLIPFVHGVGYIAGLFGDLFQSQHGSLPLIMTCSCSVPGGSVYLPVATLFCDFFSQASSDLSDISVHVGVCQNPDSVSLVRGAGVVRSDNSPPRIIPHLGKITDDSGKSSSHKHR